MTATIELAWADDDEKGAIRALAAARRRQVMNMSRPTARLVRTRADGRLAGWIGVDVDHDPALPELFSIYVEPALRNQGAGRCLRLVSALFLESRGIPTVYGRVSRSHDPGALRVWAPFTTTLDPRDLPPAFVAACEGCNLYGRECRERDFIAFDVAAYREDSARGLSRAVVEDVRRLAVEGRPFRVAKRLTA